MSGIVSIDTVKPRPMDDDQGGFVPSQASYRVGGSDRYPLLNDFPHPAIGDKYEFEGKEWIVSGWREGIRVVDLVDAAGGVGARTALAIAVRRRGKLIQ